MKKTLISLLLPLSTLYCFETISIEKVKFYYGTNSALFIDARDFKKYLKGTIPKAINIPLKRYKRFKKFLPIDKNSTIVIFCGGINCNLSKKLSKKLEKFGYTNIKQFNEGFPKWSSLKLPIMAKPIKCRDRKTKEATINGVKLVLNEDKTVNSKWLNSYLINHKLPDEVILVDVRSKEQFSKAHIKEAINLSFQNGKIDESRLKSGKVFIFYCNSGIISAEARESLSEPLKKRVFIVDDTLKCKEDCHF
jgi:rhodanese-related sulfurtransferase